MKLWIAIALTIVIPAILGCESGQNTNPSNLNVVTPQSTVTVSATATPKTNVPSTPRPDEVNEAGEERFIGTIGVTEKKTTLGVAVLSDLRVGRHATYDRIVFEFGSSLPGYHIEYIDKPVRSCGSGEVVPIAGDGWLEIRMTPAAAHTETGQPTIKTRSLSPNLITIKELKLTCDFEADVTWVVGAASPNRYRVLELNNPSRLVVDIKH